LQYVLAAARNIGRHMNGFKVIVDKSTVPVGTADRVAAAVREELANRGEQAAQAGFSVVSNPEFLKEGAAVEDFMRPDRIVIGHSFLYAGAGYGGSCFPKDVQALERTACQYEQDLLILRAVEAVNDRQKQVLGRKVVSRFGEDLSGKRFAVWGLAFKPNTDDMREAPSRVLLKELVERGATVAVYDPVAMAEAKRVLALDF